MRDVLIASAILGLLVGALFVLNRKSGTKEKDEVDAEAPRNVEKSRAHSEAEAAKDAPLSPAEEEEAADLVAFLDEIGTGEQRMVFAFDVDPLTAPIPEDRAVAEPDVFNDVTANWLSMFTWTPAPAAALPLSSVQISEPAPADPLALETFTTGWSRSEMDAILAKGKAAAR